MYNMYPITEAVSAHSYGFLAALPFIIIPLLLWSLAWKGWALWLSARNNSPVWFIVLLLVNTLGILDIIYIFAIAKRNKN